MDEAHFLKKLLTPVINLLGAGLTVNVTAFQEEAQPAHHVLVGGPLAGEGVVEARGGAGRLTAPLRHLGRSNGSGGTRRGRYDDERSHRDRLLKSTSI